MAVPTRPRNMRAFGLALALALAIGACGKKGDLQPPPDAGADEPAAPAPDATKESDRGLFDYF